MDVCIDCSDPWTLAHWWAPVLDYRVRPHNPEDLEQLRARGFAGPEEDPAIALDPRDGEGPAVWFNKVPEAKRANNRVHIDFYGDVPHLERQGATVVEVLPRWTVMRDPEGNEFCVFARRRTGHDRTGTGGGGDGI